MQAGWAEGPVALTHTGFEIILYHRYDSWIYVRLDWFS